MKKLLTIFVILAFAVVAMGQTGNVDQTATGTKLGGFQAEPKGTPPANLSNPLDTKPAQDNSTPLVQPQISQQGQVGERGANGRSGRPGHRGAQGSTGPRGPAGSANHAGIDHDIKSWNPAGVGLVNRGRVQDRQWVQNNFAPKQNSKAAGSPATTVTTVTTATTPEENGMNWRDIVLIVGLAVFFGWLFTYLIRGPLPMWLRTNTHDLTNGVKGWIKERSAAGDSREIAPPANWESTKITDINTEPKAIFRERSAHGDSREIIPIEAVKLQCAAEAQVAHSRANQAIAEATARQAQDNALAALVAGQSVSPLALAMVGHGGRFRAIEGPGGGTGYAPPAGGERTYTAKELTELGLIKPASAGKTDAEKAEEAEKKKKAATATAKT